MAASLGLARATITRGDGSKLERVTIIARGAKVTVKRGTTTIIVRPSVRVARVSRRQWTVEVGPGDDGPGETWTVDREKGCGCGS